MLKTAIIAGAILGVLHGTSAQAGVYANVETNSGFSNNTYEDTLVEPHVGWESELGESASWYAQAGPAYGFVQDGEDTQAVSGKVGLKVDITEKLEGYGEVSGITADDYDFDTVNYGVKVGATYRF